MAAASPMGAAPTARTAIDDAYDNELHFPDVPRWRETWKERNAAREPGRDEMLDVAYGSGPARRIDLLPAARPAASPTALFFHGGFWSRNSKETFRFLAPGFHAAGLNVAFAGYTLAPHGRMGTIVGDAVAATRWLAGQLERLGWHKAPLLVVGWSAGAHLAALLTGEPGVAGGIGISGAYDLRPFRDSAMNDTLRLDADDVARYSPALRLSRPAAPFAIAYGARELPAYREQSIAFHQALRDASLPTELIELAGHHHHSVLDELFRADGRLIPTLSRMADPGLARDTRSTP